MQHVEAFLVFERNGRDINRFQAGLGTAGIDHLQRPVDDGQRTQAKEVEFDQPGVFHVVLIKLGNRVVTFGIAIQRCKVGDLGWRNHHAPGVFTGVTRHAFQLARHVDQRFDLFVCLIDFRQLRLCRKGFFQRHARIGRHQFGDTVDEAIRVAQHAPHVADNRLRRHGSEGDDLRYRLTAIHLRHVLDNQVAFFHAEVDVEVGHRDTFRVQEAFEQQVKLQRVEIGDFQRIGHQRTGTRATPRAYRHVVIFRPLDEFHYDQEVARESHLVDHFQFQIQTLIVFRTSFGSDFRVREQEFQTFFQPLFGLEHQEIFGGHIAGGELWQEIFAQTDGDVTALGNFHTV
ncbi:hypothetical protein D3C73_367380 [compost metagenome]